MVLQKALLAASRRPGLRRMVTGNPATRRVVERFVAGATHDDALAVVRGVVCTHRRIVVQLYESTGAASGHLSLARRGGGA